MAATPKVGTIRRPSIEELAVLQAVGEFERRGDVATAAAIRGLLTERDRLRDTIQTVTDTLDKHDDDEAYYGCSAEPPGYIRKSKVRAALAARVTAAPKDQTCGRAEDHLAHSIPMTVTCPGVGEQVCRPDDYQHLGPWKHVAGSDSLDRCTACGTVIGK